MRQHAARYVAQYPRQAPPRVQSTLAKLSLCRTPALGGHRYACSQCQTDCVLYNSCGDRHCPQCAGARRAGWVDSAAELLLEGVDYFQVVFTLPKQLSSLALGNRRTIYNLLFQASWKALRKTVTDEQGYDPAALMVLHTWNQQLEAHAHVHAVVPGGGPSLRPSGGWKQAERFGRTTSEYLVDESRLRRAFRSAFLKDLKRLYADGQLKLHARFTPADDHDSFQTDSFQTDSFQTDSFQTDSFQTLVDQLAASTWVVYIQPPPRTCSGEPCGRQTLLKYLARYLTGGPISDRRLISADNDSVTFWARQGIKAGGATEQVPLTLPAVEFVRRWCLHILPKDFTKTRRYGGWSNKRKEAYIERCAILLESRPWSGDQASTSFDLRQFEERASDPMSLSLADVGLDSLPRCPACDQPMELISVVDKPSWAAVFEKLAAARYNARDGRGVPAIESARGGSETAGGDVCARPRAHCVLDNT